jgi:site-specific DNA recombinase
MLKDIEAGKANGILSWHPDRLARNSVDGGQLSTYSTKCIYNRSSSRHFGLKTLLKASLCCLWRLAESKYYVDNLSENTKRGLRQKVRLGHYPSGAPIGYINDVRHKTIIVDKRRAPLVVEVFELYAERQIKRLEDDCDFLKSKGIMTKGKKPLSKDQIKYMLTNPFYYGHFRYNWRST